jgi:cytochrome P450
LTALQLLDDLLAGSQNAVEDPYPTYRQLREASPVIYSDALQMWLVTRYDDVTAGLRDTRVSARRMSALIESVEATPAQRSVMVDRAMRQMINSDPPDHARRRSLIAAAFHPRRIESYRARVEATADALLDSVMESGHMDLVGDFAFPLPMTILADIVGIPVADSRAVKGWADDVAGFMSKARVDARQVAAYMTSWGELAGYFRERLAEPDHLAEHVVNRLALAIAEGDTTEEEALANLVLLAVAGHETTTSTIALGVLALLRHPEELARLRQDPSLTASAVEEILRFEPVAQWDFRLATEDTSVGATPIKAGQLLNFVLAAANRDPETFPDPDRFDIGRTPNRHVTFGIGAHHCLGSQLARLELQVAISRLLARLDDIELAGEPIYRPNIRTRGLEQLPIRFRAAA